MNDDDDDDNNQNNKMCNTWRDGEGELTRWLEVKPWLVPGWNQIY